MDVFNKLKSTVTSTVNQISSVLPGNPVTREYDITGHIGSAGQGLLWKIYSGTKRSTNQDASIFVLEKRQLDKLDMKLREEYFIFVKKGVSQLTRLRHPQILTVQHPLEESRESLAFATEPVLASLANVLGHTDNLPCPLPTHLRSYKLYDIEIKYGLMQIGEGLNFLHNDAKKIHHNLCPHNIIVSYHGAWKIFGFDFCRELSGSSDMRVEIGSIDASFYNTPNYDYLAPECLDPTRQLTTASDMFSLGALICAVHNKGKSIISADQNISYYKRAVQELRTVPPTCLLNIDEGLREHVKMMLNFSPELRADNHDFLKSPYFDDIGVKTLNYLDSIFQWDNLEKSKFYKGLPQIMEKLPHRISTNRILPCLIKEFINTSMVPFVLPNVLYIAEQCTQQEFTRDILPYLIPVMKVQEPIQVLLIFMQKMEVLLKLTPPEQVKSEVLPLLYRALESESQQIQELCLSVLPSLANLIEYPAMKNALLPRIKRLCISTSHISVRVNSLVCLGKLIEYLDKWLVLDEVLPFLPQIPSRDPAVLMGILGIYKLVLNHKKMAISKEIMATKILPFLMPLMIENSLSLNQFNSLVALVKDMVNKVEAEHRTKLEQLNSIAQEQKTFEMSAASIVIESKPPVTSNNHVDLDQLFGNPSPSRTQEKNNLSKPSNHISRSLSFEEKHRIINEKEAHMRLQQEPKIELSSGQSQSNLLDDDLKKMSLAQLDRVQNFSSPPSQQNNSPYQQNAVMQPYNFMSNQNNSMFPVQNSMINPIHNKSMKPSPMQQWSQKSSLNSNSFSDLSPLTKNKVPMNSMMPNTLMGLNHTSVCSVNSVGQSNVKQLSQSEINDLLN
uniref:SCY1-like protein 2 n=2 Tax=Cacopsylla melanoneura TaxID=428564 RepID=A0A8D8SYS2_9HEMI